MKFRINFLILFLLTLIFGLFSARDALAANFTLSGSVKDNSSTAIVGATVSVNDTNSDHITTDNSGNYSLSIPQGTYNIQVTPPVNSNYSSAVAMSQTISTDTTLNFILVSAGSVTLSGHIYDSLGNPAPGVSITLAQNQGNTSVAGASTDASGAYSIPPVSPGSYDIAIHGGSNTLNLPPNFSLQTGIYNGEYSLSQSTVLDFTIPVKKVTIHVQDASNVAVSNVQITTNNPGAQGIPIASGIPDGSGNSTYDNNHSQTTDANGNAVLWLIQTWDYGQPYTITATPPSGSIYATFFLTASITSDITEIFSLQFIHDHPVTTATLSPSADSQGNYSNPTTITLSAAAASGFTVTHTYYTIDSGSQQTYSSPFTVSGNGNHTITYWSTDNSGVTEVNNSKAFIIVTRYNLTGVVYVDANQNGVQDSGESGYNGATVTLNTGQTATTDISGNYSILGLDSSTYVETLTLPSGYTATTANPATVALSADTTENFGITPVSTPTPTSAPTPTPTPANAAPAVGTITAPLDPIQVNTAITASAPFTDANTLDTHTASWSWGDTTSSNGTVTENNGSGSVSNTHTYTAAGVYTITLKVTDNQGAFGNSAPFNYIVVYDPSAGWVAGSKEFTSPSGAVIGNAGVTGTSTFGFQVKYTNGAMVPSGKNMSLSFPGGNIDFTSTSYQWLVVNNPKALFKANGTLNGVSGYTIIVSGIDQSITHNNGLIRIQIKDSSLNVVYDTQPGESTIMDPITPVTKGQINVH